MKRVMPLKRVMKSSDKVGFALEMCQGEGFALEMCPTEEGFAPEMHQEP